VPVRLLRSLRGRRRVWTPSARKPQSYGLALVIPGEIMDAHGPSRYPFGAIYSPDWWLSHRFATNDAPMSASGPVGGSSLTLPARR
jgi:hypothetical protein